MYRGPPFGFEKVVPPPTSTRKPRPLKVFGRVGRNPYIQFGPILRRLPNFLSPQGCLDAFRCPTSVPNNSRHPVGKFRGRKENRVKIPSVLKRTFLGMDLKSSRSGRDRTWSTNRDPSCESGSSGNSNPYTSRGSGVVGSTVDRETVCGTGPVKEGRRPEQQGSRESTERYGTVGGTWNVSFVVLVVNVYSFGFEFRPFTKGCTTSTTCCLGPTLGTTSGRDQSNHVPRDGRRKCLTSSGIH